MPAIKEMREVCQQKKPNARGKMVWAGNWYNRLVNRHFSIYFTWLFVRLGVSANQVTFMMIVAGLGGFALCIPHVLWVNVLGMFLLMFAELLDCVDGEVARWTKQSSLKGVYLDLVNHVLCNAPAWAICGLHLYVLTDQPKYLVLAFLGYAMGQIKLALVAEYHRILPQIPKVEARPPQVNGSGVPRRSVFRRVLSMARWLFDKSVDELVVRIAVVIALVALYFGAKSPLVFMAWWFVVFGGINSLGEIVSKYYFYIPHAGHVKKV